MVWPLLIYGAGLAAQAYAKDRTAADQQADVFAEQGRQRAARAKGRRLLLQDAYRSSPIAMAGPEQEAYDDAMGDANASDQRALAIFDGSPEAAGAPPEAVRNSAARASTARASATARYAAPGRARAKMAMLSREDQARIAGINQRAARSFSMLPTRLDLDAQRYSALNDGGQLAMMAGLGWNQRQMNQPRPAPSLGTAGYTDSRGAQPYVDPYTGDTVMPA